MNQRVLINIAAGLSLTAAAAFSHAQQLRLPDRKAEQWQSKEFYAYASESRGDLVHGLEIQAKSDVYKSYLQTGLVEVAVRQTYNNSVTGAFGFRFAFVCPVLNATFDLSNNSTLLKGLVDVNRCREQWGVNYDPSTGENSPWSYTANFTVQVQLSNALGTYKTTGLFSGKDKLTQGVFRYNCQLTVKDQASGTLSQDDFVLTSDGQSQYSSQVCTQVNSTN